ncbi:hypothetical protein PLICRDRAFT_178557 [Plicaturopsis crispa FD-325 SS-3]|nr:hypothetical protein PLICRDRAFT_178557 [Plicaturopsis crispa FD-325 SS-3]
MLYLTFLLAAALSSGASAALYATQPTANTVYNVDEPGEITWVDDGMHPRLKDMGPVRIDLFTASGARFIATLARNVNAGAKSTNITFPQLNITADEYMLSFVSKSPPLTVYTADFAINPSANITSIDPRIAAPLLTLVLPSTTYVSQLSPTTGPAAQQTVYASPIAGSDSGKPLSRQSSAASGKSASQRIDMEKIKFRLVFILWPALIGITMAM